MSGRGSARTIIKPPEMYWWVVLSAAESEGDGACMAGARDGKRGCEGDRRERGRVRQTAKTVRLRGRRAVSGRG